MTRDLSYNDLALLASNAIVQQVAVPLLQTSTWVKVKSTPPPVKNGVLAQSVYRGTGFEDDIVPMLIITAISRGKTAMDSISVNVELKTGVSRYDVNDAYVDTLGGMRVFCGFDWPEGGLTSAGAEQLMPLIGAVYHVLFTQTLQAAAPGNYPGISNLLQLAAGYTELL